MEKITSENRLTARAKSGKAIRRDNSIDTNMQIVERLCTLEEAIVSGTLVDASTLQSKEQTKATRQPKKKVADDIAGTEETEDNKE